MSGGSGGFGGGASGGGSHVGNFDHPRPRPQMHRFGFYTEAGKRAEIGIYHISRATAKKAAEEAGIRLGWAVRPILIRGSIIASALGGLVIPTFAVGIVGTLILVFSMGLIFKTSNDTYQEIMSVFWFGILPLVGIGGSILTIRAQLAHNHEVDRLLAAENQSSCS
jgi:hypothetical protein